MVMAGLHIALWMAIINTIAHFLVVKLGGSPMGQALAFAYGIGV